MLDAMNEDQEYTVGEVVFLHQLIFALMECVDEALCGEKIPEKVLQRMETFFENAKQGHHPDRASILAMHNCLEHFREQVKKE